MLSSGLCIELRLGFTKPRERAFPRPPYMLDDANVYEGCIRVVCIYKGSLGGAACLDISFDNPIAEGLSSVFMDQVLFSCTIKHWGLFFKLFPEKR